MFKKFAQKQSNSAVAAPSGDHYQFTENWFEPFQNIWAGMILNLKPKKILEIGSYEGASACFLIETLSPTTELELHCVDNWEGGIEHHKPEMKNVEGRFFRNLEEAKKRAANPVQLVVHKSSSDIALAKLIAAGMRGSFDLVYVDGSHQAPDVLCDAILGFKLLRVGGMMIFDDYLWFERLPGGADPLRCPKPAIDAFTNLYFRKIRIRSEPLYQIYLEKLAD